MFQTRSTTRRSLLWATATSTAFTALARGARSRTGAHTGAPEGGFGPLTADPEGFLDLPAGFRYDIVSSAGELMDDGLFVPGRPDGMAAFAGPDGTTVLVRNHELDHGVGAAFGPNNEHLARVATELYDAGRSDPGPAQPSLGGTTTLVYDTRQRKLVRAHLSLAGTLRNCAGGSTPWGSWISCEESVARAGRVHARDHGYCFEVPSGATELVPPVPLQALGRMYHEAVGVDPRTGIVYLTEDRHDSLFYRCVPNEPGHLAAGGRLQALAILAAPSLDTRNWHRHTRIEPGEALEVRWVDLDDPDAPNDDLRARGFLAGAARFARGEGIAVGKEELFFACTIGGASQLGQIWRYRPSALEGDPREKKEAGRLELFFESTDSDSLANCDNLTVAPWGDLVVCEDSPRKDRVLGITPEGRVYPLAQNVAHSTEFAGACFSPDGTTLFVNAQDQDRTVAITGPWERRA